MSFYGGVDGSSTLEVDFDKNVTHLYESISESDWDVAISDLTNNSDEARTWVVRHRENGQIMWRFLPLHSACARQPPEHVVNALLSAYRQGAQCRDDQGMLPLHYACGNQASVEIIRLLLLAFPEGANIADPNGMLPLHYLAQWGPSSMEAMEVLLFANRNALKARDIDGNTAVDLARDGDYDDQEKNEVIQALQGYMPNKVSENSTMNHPGSSRSMSKHLNSSNNLERKETSPPQHLMEQQTDLKSFTTMPKTSDAVRRLQEAAAAQQYARESYLKSSESVIEERDDASGVGSMQRTSVYGSLNGGSGSGAYSRPAMEDSSVSLTMDATSQRMVSNLKSEVEKLRNEAAAAEAEAEKQLKAERVEMQKAVNEMKAKLASCEKEIMESLSELTAKEEFGQYIEARLKDKENELAAAMKKNEQLRSDLDTMKQNITKYKEKTTKLDEHLGALSKSMEGMMEEQEQIMKASLRHEEHMKKVSLARQQKMQELIDQEVTFARVSLEKQKQSDLGSEEMINAALESQKKLMAAVAGVLTPRD